MTRKLTLLILSGSLLAGCANLDPADERSRIFDAAVQRQPLAAPAGLPDSQAVVPLRADDQVTQNAAIARALAANPSLRAELAEAGLARAAWAGARLPENPLLGVIWRPEEGGEDFLDIDLTASVMGMLGTPWRARAARAEYDAAQAAAIARVIDFTAEVRSAWVAAVAARQRLGMMEEVERAANAAVLIAEELRAAGNIPLIELERERTFASAALLGRMQAAYEAERARNALALLIAADPAVEWTLPDRLDEPEMRDLSGIERAAIAASLPLQQSRLEADAMGRRAGIENFASLLEHAEIGGVFEREDGDWHEAASVETVVPLFDWGQARRAAAQIRAEQALDRHAARAASVREGARTARQAAEMAADQLAFARETQLPQSERLLDETMQHYNAMQLGVFELISAFESRIGAGEAYLAALEQAWQANIAIDRLAAGGSAGMLSMSDAAGAPEGAAGREGGH